MVAPDQFLRANGVTLEDLEARHGPLHVGHGFRKVGLTAGALVAFAFLLEPLGFPLATLAFMVFLLRAIEPQRWRLTLTLSIVTMVLCVLVFQVWLQVQFPEGPVSIHAFRKWLF